VTGARAMIADGKLVPIASDDNDGGAFRSEQPYKRLNQHLHLPQQRLGRLDLFKRRRQERLHIIKPLALGVG
jgi:hypothetical protein